MTLHHFNMWSNDITSWFIKCSLELKQLDDKSPLHVSFELTQAAHVGNCGSSSQFYSTLLPLMFVHDNPFC